MHPREWVVVSRILTAIKHLLIQDLGFMILGSGFWMKGQEFKGSPLRVSGSIRSEGECREFSDDS